MCARGIFTPGSARHRFIALTVIAIVDRDDAMMLRDLRRNACVEPHSLRVVGIAVHEHDPRSAITVREVVDLDAVAGREEAILLSDHHGWRRWTRCGGLLGRHNDRRQD
jgi:hypothetical protein